MPSPPIPPSVSSTSPLQRATGEDDRPLTGTGATVQETLRAFGALAEDDDEGMMVDFMSAGTSMRIHPISSSSASSSQSHMMYHQTRRMMMMNEDEVEDEGYSPRVKQKDEYDEFGVRKPDKVRQQQLLGHTPTLEDSFGRTVDPSVDWMFGQPPSNQGSLDAARQQAMSENRWLLVNLQSHLEFTSHLLNRDTWTHETIIDILQTSFLFWQRGHTTGDGLQYMNMHRLSQDDDLPHIGVIDPRTGARLLSLTVMCIN
jgi:hypothetical protein